MIADKYGGTIIVPMTLVNPEYYNEIISRLINDGVDVRHFILYVSREEIKRRIKKRTIPFIGKDTFAMNSIERCVNAFDNLITDVKIHTDDMSVDNAVEKIAELCNLQLSADKKSKFGKFLYRTGVMIKHIR